MAREGAVGIGIVEREGVEFGAPVIRGVDAAAGLQPEYGLRRVAVGGEEGPECGGEGVVAAFALDADPVSCDDVIHERVYSSVVMMRSQYSSELSRCAITMMVNSLFSAERASIERFTSSSVRESSDEVASSKSSTSACL